MENRVTCNILEASRMLAAAIMSDVPAYLFGKPGCGKTSIVKQAFHTLKDLKKYEDRLYIWPANERNNLENGGLWRVNPETGLTERCAVAELDFSGPMFFFIDEFSDAPTHEQSQYYRLFLSHELGDKKLPEGSYVCAAGNRPEDGAAAREVSTALKDRCMCLDVEPCHKATVAYAIKNDWDARIVGFLRAYGSEVIDNGFDAYAPYGGSTPRGFERLNKLEQSKMLLGDTVILGKTSDLATKMIVGCIDHSAGHKYAAFRSLQLPDVDTVFKTPESAEVPQNPDIIYTFCATIVAACKNDTRQLKNVFTYAKRLGRVNGAALMFDILTKYPQLVKTSFWTDVCLEYYELQR